MSESSRTPEGADVPIQGVVEKIKTDNVKDRLFALRTFDSGQRDWSKFAYGVALGAKVEQVVGLLEKISRMELTLEEEKRVQNLAEGLQECVIAGDKVTGQALVDQQAKVRRIGEAIESFALAVENRKAGKADSAD